jgi:hypothetical protein
MKTKRSELIKLIERAVIAQGITSSWLEEAVLLLKREKENADLPKTHF